ncbi:hypothetical protein niasHT_000364 [Heterodera trifolii]|uniref:Uncharacterized protein n=1 Tax=Heterodera trifolii TaxID=157864 RepID=A0ABD2MC22_9BILA
MLIDCAVVVTCFDAEIDRRNFLLSIFDTEIAANNESVFIIGSLRNQGKFQQVPLGFDGSIKYSNMWVNKLRDADALARHGT